MSGPKKRPMNTYVKGDRKIEYKIKLTSNVETYSSDASSGEGESQGQQRMAIMLEYPSGYQLVIWHPGKYLRKYEGFDIVEEYMREWRGQTPKGRLETAEEVERLSSELNFAERILGCNVRTSKHYYVKWFGRPWTKRTWESEDFLKVNGLGSITEFEEFYAQLCDY
ncbi:hypothetical protein K470DRAFT_268029 [Piedraia hortae CBS 480.64]|uniref:Chromo domain-containing protein n=1 Tax=Piedraia hortae CBS 480.64 TaxID=1314780 RepID=A0A6A7C959_9PEZI|nr:hypothetical protein K470DRAFT_268029 [Piedraia hortae CBS 480.64]